MMQQVCTGMNEVKITRIRHEMLAKTVNNWGDEALDCDEPYCEARGKSTGVLVD